VVTGGELSNHKGVNFPGVRLSAPSITPKDRADIEFGITMGVDGIALSFVRQAHDLVGLRRLLRNAQRPPAVIAKIERREAIENLDSILDAADCVMIARGDLGVEFPPERVPILQKRIIERANQREVLVITATQMLESMVHAARPTRAEASDVANAIFDGTDAVMLSAETASGMYPVEAVQMMARIIMAAENNRQLNAPVRRDHFKVDSETDEFTDALAGAANYAAEQIDAKFIVVFTQTGFAARLMSKFRPTQPIIALTPSSWVARRMNMLWGVQPFVLVWRESQRGTDSPIAHLQPAESIHGATHTTVGGPMMFDRREAPQYFPDVE
jgi:pyruvate kinase